MIERATVFVAKGHNPHRNLALEALLTESMPTGEAGLMLWQNDNAVIIGAGQNAWRECDIAAMERDHVALARRPSGGGAVFHDLGNLNFSFFLPRGEYDVQRQLRVVLSAVRAFGVEAEMTGRNDLTADGRKFSGNAFRFVHDRALHHGTLLVCADMARGEKYLSVSPEKLKSKGVASVRARVVNLAELADVNVARLAETLAEAFAAEYGPARHVEAEALDLPGLEERAARYASWEWNFARSPRGEFEREHRFAWGGVQILFSVLSGNIAGVFAYTDAMDENLAGKIASALDGCPFQPAAVEERLFAVNAELAAWLAAVL
ncbi:MAG TPA: lipoate--protein ligase [Candidatus Ornithocaccomicrobium faecavium]|uniref:lipoate--protein ligase n=1 Tax=Candidatus Ornithocaccomicrobium faecavium TaxID=2840890 RepID=A0A9D1P7P0_9FIRM|nr:lipoate--protein ligase [Candidatus Ornithocaccomicrobium faecavium]